MNDSTSTDEKICRAELVNDVSIVKNSDLSEKSPIFSPVISNLPKLYNNLRANEMSNSGLLNESVSSISTYNSGKEKKGGSSRKDDTTARQDTDNAWDLPINAKSGVFEEVNGDMKVSQENIDGKHLSQMKISNIFLTEGMPLLKISHKSKKRILLYVEPNDFKFWWRTAFNPTAMSTSGSIQRILGFKDSNIAKNKEKGFTIDDIKSFYYSASAANYREELHISKEFEEKWITIIYFNHRKGKWKSFHLIADTFHDSKKLLTVLKSLKKIHEELAQNFFVNSGRLIGPQNTPFWDINSNESEKITREFLTFNDILKYAKRLNININDKYLRSIFEKVADTGKNLDNPDKTLNFEQFKHFVSILKRRDDINRLWEVLCGGQKVMNFDTFKKFVLETQQDYHSDESLLKIFKKFSVNNSNQWVPENLNNFLLSKYSNAIKSEVANIDDYYSHPINEYYIASSHNTYLTGRQLGGGSSIEGYIRALQRGCRCVEVDVWDGSIDNLENEKQYDEPIVNHGRTFTTGISFLNVIKVIKKYGFFSSNSPVIISLEVHCSFENQKNMLAILKEVLGDSLVTDFINDTSTLPSPNDLKNKFLVKVKKTTPFVNLVSDDNGNFITSSTSTTPSFSEDNSSASSRRSSFSISRKGKDTRILEELSNLGVYIQGLKFRNFSLPESKTFNHCFSLSEKSFNSMIKNDEKRASIDKHNRKYLMRVYPSKMRLTSSNFVPISQWSHGVQMVATNWQTYDLGQQINESMFRIAEKNGYILKPPDLRKPLLKSRNKNFSIVRPKRIRFSFNIISAHQLPKFKGTGNAINPFVSLEIIGCTEIEWDLTSLKGRTSIIAENGFNPEWNQRFSGVITFPDELVFIKFSINSSSSTKEEDEPNTIGTFVTNLRYLKQGYRYLSIHDISGEELIYSSLFVQIRYFDL